MKTKIIGITLCMLMITTCFSAMTAMATDLIDQEQENWDCEIIICNNNNLVLSVAQSFKPSMTTLTKVEVYIRRYVDPTQDITLSIRSDLSGSDLVSVSKDTSEIEDSYDWIEFDFDTFCVTVDQTYYIVLEMEDYDPPAPKGYLWAFKEDVNPYSRGSMYQKLGNNAWESCYTNADTCFRTYGISNVAPNTPNKPSGTTSGNTGVTYTYSTSTTDPNCDQVYYWFDWDDGTNSGWVGPYSSGSTGSASHSWVSPGTYNIKAKAKDPDGAESGWSSTLAVNIQNSPPNTPSTPSGPSSGSPGTSYEYTTSTTDPDGDWIYYKFSWGDGSESEWIGPVSSGSPASASHSWSSPGTYSVKAKAKDTLDGESGWSSAKSVAIVGNPSVITNEATGVTSSSATLNGALTDMGGASSCQVWFQWGTTVNYGQETTHQTKTSTGSFSQSISGLSPSTTYHFRAAASNSYGTVHGGDKTFTTPLETAEWTFMVYMCGDNDLEDEGFDDINEMEAAGSTDDVHFIVLFDGDSNGDTVIYRIDQDPNGYDSTIISSTLNDNQAVIPASGEVNMGDPDTLVNFAEWTISNYPAYRYCIILWDHGTGWKALDGESGSKHVCTDGTSGGDALETDELKTAFNTISNNGNDPIDLIGFDACVMQMIEIEYELREYGEYMVASEAGVPLDGFNYEDSCMALINNPTMSAESLGEQIVDDYIDWGGHTLSTVDLSAIDNLANDVSSLGSALIDDTYHSDIDTAIQNTQNYLPEDDDYKDLYDFAVNIQNEINDNTIDQLAQQVINHINPAVKSEGHDSIYDDSHGISIYIPLNDYMTEYEDLSFAQDTQWDEFLDWFTNSEPNKPSNPSPANGATDVSLDPYLSVTATDPDGDKMTVIFYDASTNSEIGRQNNVASGSTATCQWSNRVPHTTYQWYAKANDGWKTVKSDTWSFTTGDAPNQRPEPPVISGPSRVKINQEYPYTFISTDPENHDLYYYIDWGDGTNTGWIGPYNSGEVVTKSHSWSEHGSVTIKAKAKDIHDDESDWGYLPITKRRSILFVDILENFFEKHPNMFPLVRTLLQRIGL